MSLSVQSERGLSILAVCDEHRFLSGQLDSAVKEQKEAVKAFKEKIAPLISQKQDLEKEIMAYLKAKDRTCFAHKGMTYRLAQKDRKIKYTEPEYVDYLMGQHIENAQELAAKVFTPKEIIPVETMICKFTK